MWSIHSVGYYVTRTRNEVLVPVQYEQPRKNYQVKKTLKIMSYIMNPYRQKGASGFSRLEGGDGAVRVNPEAQQKGTGILLQITKISQSHGDVG